MIIFLLVLLILIGLVSGLGLLYKFNKNFHNYIKRNWKKVVAIVGSGGLIIVGGGYVLDNSPTGTTYYVAKTGTDGAGHSGEIGDPFLTIAYAARYRALSPGDSIIVREGNYNEIVYFYGSGTTGNPITLTNYTNEKVVVDGTGISIPLAYALIMIGTSSGAGRTNITIKDIHIENSSQGGIRAWQHPAISVSNIHIDNCYFGNISKWSIWMGTDYVSTYGPSKNIRVSNCTFNGIALGYPTTFSGKGITFVGVQNITCDYNTVLYCKYICFELSGGSIYGNLHHNNVHINRSQAFYIETSTNNNRTTSWMNISHNVIWGDMAVYNGGIKIDTESGTSRLHNNTISNNVINLTSTGGTTTFGVLVGNSGGGGRQENMTVKFNTIYIAQGSTSSAPICLGSSLVLRNWTIANNILVSGGSLLYQVYSSSVPYTSTVLIRANNLYYHTGKATNNYYMGTTGEVTFEATAVRDNPDFVSIGSDFHLEQTSPAKNAANAIYTVTTDYDGVTRGVPAEIGAFEFVDEPPTSPSVELVDPQNGENIGTTPTCSVTVSDPESDTMTVKWFESSTGSWRLVHTDLNTATGTTLNYVYVNATSDDTTYYWAVNATDTDSTYYNETFNFFTGTRYYVTIRNDGVDYFTWLGANVTASTVDGLITGFDEY